MLVLVVDDDETVVRALSRVLRRAGYEVLATTNLTAARHTLATIKDIRVAIIDVHVEHEDGYDLAEHLATHHPDIAAIMISGEIDRREAPAIRRLEKPIRATELVQAVRSALGDAA